MTWRRASLTEFVGARDRSPRREFLSYLDPAEYSELDTYDLYLSEDGLTGFAVHPDGDISNVFNNGAPGRGAEAVRAAIEHGGWRLNAFDPFLPKYYSRFGFVEVERVPFDPKLAPAGWKYSVYGTPDVVFMELPDRRPE